MEKQRVAIARALVQDPALLRCDEPKGNLDSAKGELALELLERLTKDTKKIVLCVTHDDQVAGGFPRRLRMSDGRIVGLGV